MLLFSALLQQGGWPADHCHPRRDHHLPRHGHARSPQLQALLHAGPEPGPRLHPEGWPLRGPAGAWPGRGRHLHHRGQAPGQQTCKQCLTMLYITWRRLRLLPSPFRQRPVEIFHTILKGVLTSHPGVLKLFVNILLKCRSFSNRLYIKHMLVFLFYPNYSLAFLCTPFQQVKKNMDYKGLKWPNTHFKHIWDT